MVGTNPNKGTPKDKRLKGNPGKKPGPKVGSKNAPKAAAAKPPAKSTPKKK
jgi:hypothetical protein